MRRTLLAAALITSLVGCATRPTADELANADYGRYPSDFQGTVKRHMQLRLKDPESARYEFRNPVVQAWSGYGGRNYGYASCVLVNAKNSFGGYTGFQKSYYMVRNDQVVVDLHGSPGPYGSVMVDGLCSSINQ